MLGKHSKFLALALLVVILAGFAFIPSATRFLGGFNATSEDSFVNNGFDVIWYSGNQSGETVRVDGKGSMRIAAPTALATATPGLVIDCAGVSNCLEVRDAATPVFTVGQNGAINGKVMAYPTPNVQINCRTDTITDTATYTSSVTAISTPTFATCAMNSITGDAIHCAAIVGSGAVTVTVRNSAATPAANAAGAAVTWCAGGTP